MPTDATVRAEGVGASAPVLPPANIVKLAGHFGIPVDFIRVGEDVVPGWTMIQLPHGAPGPYEAGSFIIVGPRSRSSRSTGGIPPMIPLGPAPHEGEMGLEVWGLMDVSVVAVRDLVNACEQAGFREDADDDLYPWLWRRAEPAIRALRATAGRPEPEDDPALGVGVIQVYDDDSTVALDSYAGGNDPAGAWSSLRLRFRDAQGRERVRFYREAPDDASDVAAEGVEVAARA